VFIGRGALDAAFRGGSFDWAMRRFGVAFLVAFFALALRAGFRAADFRRGGAARFFDFAAFFLALRFFAMMSS
jgi:hypothetical protein